MIEYVSGKQRKIFRIKRYKIIKLLSINPDLIKKYKIF